VDYAENRQRQRLVTCSYKSQALEGIQRRFTKKFPGLYRYCYQDRLRRLQLLSLELRRLYADLVWCYKIGLLFGVVDVQSHKFFEFNMTCVLLEDISTNYTKIVVYRITFFMCEGSLL